MQSTVTDPSERLLRGHRSIRTVAPPEAPWAGTLTRLPDGTSRVLVDAEVLGTDWRGWDAAASGHLLAPTDVVRRVDGHDVALPMCTERLDSFLHRRTAAGTPLSEGEAVTLVSSILRGTAEVLRDRGEVDGEWWLTDEGRPVLATDTGADARTSASGHLSAVSEMLPSRSALAPVLDDLRAALEDPRILRRDQERLEDAVFDAADPTPLAVTMLVPGRARSLSAAVSDDLDADVRPRRGRWADLLATHVDGDIADLTSHTVTRVWRRLRRARTGGRRRPWLWGGGLAAGVLAVGLLWPTGADGPATADVATPTPSPAPGAMPADAAARAGAADGASGSDSTLGGGTDALEASSGTEPTTWPAATEELLALRTACGADAACLSGVVEDPARALPAGVIDRPASERTVTLLDEFGGAAVLRVDPVSAGAASQLVVVVRTHDGCLLRDVHDVARQAAG